MLHAFLLYINFLALSGSVTAPGHHKASRAFGVFRSTADDSRRRKCPANWLFCESVIPGSDLADPGPDHKPDLANV